MRSRRAVWREILLAALAVTAARAFAADEARELAIIPRPVKVERRDGAFAIDASTRIAVARGAAEVAPVAAQLADALRRATALAVQVVEAGEPAGDSKGAIRLVLDPARTDLGAEGYALDVTPDAVVLRASQAAGLFYGVQTLRQLLPPEAKGAAAIPCVAIEDRPRFEWRGLLVDSARHFFPRESLEKFIDVMALYKFNRLQIHFTDDQSWTLPIDAYPKLMQVGARGGPYAMDWRWLGLGNGIGSGRWHTKEDIRALVQYATDRHVVIVPEIEMPAHAGAWLASYPELMCTSHDDFPAPAVGARGEGDSRIVLAAHRELCPGSEATYKMIEGVIAEVAAMFPGRYIHLGGDEALKLAWEHCERCRAVMKAQGLKDLRELQSHFIRRTGQIIAGQGRHFVGWDEIMEGGLAPNAIVMSWRGVEPGQAAVKAGHDVVFSPTSHCYFDYTYKQIPTEKVYAFEPLAGLSPEAVGRVKGVQGNLWSENIADLARLEYMAYPRACALAEVAWSPATDRRWAEFQTRLAAHRARLEALRVNFNREE